MGTDTLDRAAAYGDKVAFENKNEHGYYNFKATSYHEPEDDSSQLNLYNQGSKTAYLRIVSDERYELVTVEGLSTHAVRISEEEFHKIRKIACKNLEHNSSSAFPREHSDRQKRKKVRKRRKRYGSGYP